MSPVEAAKALMDAQRRDPALRMVIAGLLQRGGWSDIPEWVGADPEGATAVALEMADIDEQLKHFDDLLSSGSLE